MSFSNAGGTSFYDPNQNVANLAQQNTSKAVLFLFQPLARPFSNQAHRPLTYNMTDDIFHAAAEAAHLAHMGKATPAVVASVVNRADALGSILPSADPTMRIGLGSLSEFWKFMLVITGDFPEPNQVQVYSRNNTTREFYFGYCQEEPINPWTLHMTTPTINDNARMIITHKTVFQSYPSYGSGGNSPHYSTMSDADIVDPSLFSCLTDVQAHMNAPLNLSQSSSLQAGEGGSFMVMPQPMAASGLSNQVTNIAIDNAMHNPQENLTAIMQAAITANGKMSSDRMTQRESILGDSFGRADILEESMMTYFQSGSSTVMTAGLTPNTTYPLGYIRQKYRPDVLPQATDRSVMFSPYDQTNRTANSMFCALLCSAIPPLLMQLQLLNFTFQFQTRCFKTNAKNVWVIHNVDPAVTMSQEAIRQRVNSITNTLLTGMFKMIFDARGDFEIHGSFGAANVTHCYLNFYCDSVQMLEPYEVPTIFGGLTSTLIADPKTHYQNTSQYSMLLTAMTGSELTENIPEMRDTAPVFNVPGNSALGYASPVPFIHPNMFR